VAKDPPITTPVLSPHAWPLFTLRAGQFALLTFRIWGPATKAIALLLFLSASSGAQPVNPANAANQSGPGANKSQGQNSSNGTLTGPSYARGSFDRLKDIPPPHASHRREVLCYIMANVSSTSQPVVLQPTDDIEKSCSGERDPEGMKRCAASAAAPTWNVCSSLNEERPLLSEDQLVVAVDVSNIPLSQLDLLNINVAAQQSTAINPAPLHSNVASAQGLPGAAPVPTPTVLYLPWPYLLSGDTIPTVSVTAIFSSPLPGQPWSRGTFYPFGTTVVPNVLDGHAYAALTSGISGDYQPPFAPSPLAITNDYHLTWIDLGSSNPAPNVPAKFWLPGHAFSAGDVIQDTASGHYFIVSSTSGDAHTGSSAPPFQIQQRALFWDTVIDGSTNWKRIDTYPTSSLWTQRSYLPGETVRAPAGLDDNVSAASQIYAALPGGMTNSTPPNFTTDREVSDGGQVWHLVSSSPVPSKLQRWRPSQSYKRGVIIEAPNRRFFVATVEDGISGIILPDFAHPFVKDGQVKWQLLGPTDNTANMLTPSDALLEGPDSLYVATKPGTTGSVEPSLIPIKWQDQGPTGSATLQTSQNVAPEQIVSILNQPLPQVHSLSYFNLDAGVVVSTVKVKSYGFASPPSGCGTSSNPCPPGTAVQTASNTLVDPVLLLTWYAFHKLDAERRWTPSDLIPNPTFGLSLSSPTGNFYLGLSSEVTRNVQMTCGLNYAKEPVAPSSGFVGIPSGTSTTPLTVQKFKPGAYCGFTFNFVGFIQGLFGGGGGGGGGGAAAAGAAGSVAPSH
jgi:hypothetical protein